MYIYNDNSTEQAWVILFIFILKIIFIKIMMRRVEKVKQYEKVI